MERDRLFVWHGEGREKKKEVPYNCHEREGLREGNVGDVTTATLRMMEDDSQLAGHLTDCVAKGDGDKGNKRLKMETGAARAWSFFGITLSH